MKHILVTIGGRVQGVGFRPFVYRLAVRHGCNGWVRNTPAGVLVDAAADDRSIGAFLTALRTETPPLALVSSFEVTELDEPGTSTSFSIKASPPSGTASVLVSPDVATCDDCLRELFDPGDRRYLYPFINCTNCGPRFTLTRTVPYDRALTSMACFPLCDDCAAEYADPSDRRFHAQPDACPRCGPRLWLTDGTADTSPPSDAGDFVAPVLEAAKAVLDGAILAMKGLGGFHLVCDARNAEAVGTLRRRKHRPGKALAVMAADLDAVRSVAVPTDAEIRLLLSRERPIVLVRKRPDALPGNIAPDTDTVGVMLPYTPLQHVFLRRCATLRPGVPPILVATSGNAKGDPICLGNREALSALRGIADLFLLHDRDILVRADDSVVRCLPDGTRQIVRRARGYVPAPLPLPDRAGNMSVLAFGADLKNTLTLTRGRDAFVSQYVGDLGNPRVDAFSREAAAHLERILRTGPSHGLVCDLHPDFVSSRQAEREAEARRLPLHRLQHHAAHLFAVLAEHRYEAPAAGLILDGTGYGTDGTIWGGEVLLADGAGWSRLGSLTTFPLPGGDKAVLEPWRIACGMAARLGLPVPSFPDVPGTLAEAVSEAVLSGLAVRTSSCGRLFDAVSALLGLCTRITYEGQAAIRLETAQDPDASDAPDWVRLVREDGMPRLDAGRLFAGASEALHDGVPVPRIARWFHLELARGLADLVAACLPDGVRTVALGGGVWLNATLNALATEALRTRGCRVLRPVDLPPGDGAVSYGQAAWLVKTASAADGDRPVRLTRRLPALMYRHWRNANAAAEGGNIKLQ